MSRQRFFEVAFEAADSYGIKLGQCAMMLGRGLVLATLYLGVFQVLSRVLTEF